jgi:PIN domain nuclease of toxin-antitoxin system
MLLWRTSKSTWNEVIDSHTFLWFIDDDPKLSAVAKSIIEDPNSDVLSSAARPWEMAIKASIGKLRARPVAQALTLCSPARAQEGRGG